MTNKKATYKKAGKSPLKKFIGFAHLWLGLISGALVLFLGITGCILAFEEEIRNVTEPYRFVKEQKAPIVQTSVIAAAASKAMNKEIRAVQYPGPGKAVIAGFYNKKEYVIAFVNPYTAEVLKVKNMKKDFFRVVLEGHFNLWLPRKIGQPIVASATLVFVVMLISGIILWWPRNKAAIKQRFRLRFNVSFKRLNYDMHNVLGFYASWIAIFIAITGLVWGFQWFSQSLYYVTSGGKSLPEHVHPHSDTTIIQTAKINADDFVYAEMAKKAMPGEGISIYYPKDKEDAIEGAVNHRPGTHYKTDYYHYDQYTLKELPATGVYAGSFNEASTADKIRRMNYDIHVGAIWGLTGKIIAFLASLISASLPVTGFLIWRGRKKKKPSAKSQPIKEEAGQTVKDLQPALN